MIDYGKKEGLQKSWDNMQRIVSWIYNGHKYKGWDSSAWIMDSVSFSSSAVVWATTPTGTTKRKMANFLTPAAEIVLNAAITGKRSDHFWVTVPHIPKPPTIGNWNHMLNVKWKPEQPLLTSGNALCYMALWNTWFKPNQHIGMISEGSCYTEDWSNGCWKFRNTIINNELLCPLIDFLEAML